MSRSKYSSDVPASRPPPRDTEVSSSLVSPRTPIASTRVSRRTSDAPSFRKSSWSSSFQGTEGTRDQRRRSTVSFAAPSLAPSDSISKVKTHAARSSRDYSDSGTTSRRRSAPWQSVSYQTRASRGSSLSGAAWSGSGAPLTETNLEVFNGRRTSGPEDDQVSRELVTATSAQRTGKSSRRYSQAITDDSQPESRTLATRSRYSSRRSGTATGKHWPEGEDYTAASSRRRSSVTEDPTLSSTPRYARPTIASQASRSRVPTQARQSTTVAPSDSALQTSVPSSTKYTRRGRSRAVTSARPSTVAEGAAGAGVAGAAAYASRDREADRSRTIVGPDTRVESQKSTTSYSQTNTRHNAPTEAKSRRSSAPPTKARSSSVSKSESATMASKSSATARQSQLVSRATAPQEPSQTSSPSAPDSASSPAATTSAAAPSALEWERKIRIVTTLKPDGRLIRDREVSMRRIGPQSQTVTA